MVINGRWNIREEFSMFVMKTLWQLEAAKQRIQLELAEAKEANTRGRVSRGANSRSQSRSRSRRDTDDDIEPGTFPCFYSDTFCYGEGASKAGLIWW